PMRDAMRAGAALVVAAFGLILAPGLLGEHVPGWLGGWPTLPGLRGFVLYLGVIATGLGAIYLSAVVWRRRARTG
ncbi:hypothetical protein NHG85_11095, partial [Limimaricola sp. ASW11-118]